MANNTGWVAGRGQGLTWGSAGFTVANFNSLASGSVVVATTAIANATPLDLYADVSYVLTVGGTTTATSYMALYILPLNQDASTYGDGTPTGTAAPAAAYMAGSAGVRSGIASGATITGIFRGVVLPPGNFLFALTNN